MAEEKKFLGTAGVERLIENIRGEINEAIEASEAAAAGAYVAQKAGKSLVDDTEITKLSGVSEGANKVEASTTNGKIKIDGTETTVYAHPATHSSDEVVLSQPTNQGYAGKTVTEAVDSLKDEIDGVNNTANTNRQSLETLEGGDTGSSVREIAESVIDGLDLGNTYSPKKHDHVMADVTDLDEKFQLIERYIDDADQTAKNLMGEDINKSARTIAGEVVSDYAATVVQTYETKDSAAQKLVEAKEYADDEVGALEEDIGSVDALSTTNKTVVGAINEVLAAVGAGGNDAKVSVIVETTTTSGAAKTYGVYQGSVRVGTIDIPKDMVVESGEVVVNPTGQAEGTYIKLVLANATNDVIYVNVGTLVDIYKAKANAAQVQLAIDSSTREISATVVAGSITATELANDAVITAKIADKNVTKSKLAQAVQDTLDNADAKLAGLGDDTVVGLVNGINGNMNARLSETGDIGKAIKSNTERIDAIESVTYTEITAADIDTMFAD